MMNNKMYISILKELYDDELLKQLVFSNPFFHLIDQRLTWYLANWEPVFFDQNKQCLYVKPSLEQTREIWRIY